MSKFKVGDLAWSPRSGFLPLENSGDGGYSLRQVGDGVTYTPEGFRTLSDKYPTLLTVEEAARLGYYPPKKKVQKTFYVRVAKDESRRWKAYGLLCLEEDMAKFLDTIDPNGITAIVTFEAEE